METLRTTTEIAMGELLASSEVDLMETLAYLDLRVS